MSDIRVRRVVRCPVHDASRHLAAFVAEHSMGDGMISIALRLPINIFNERRTLLERRVLANLYPLTSVRDPHPTYSVSLSPKKSGLFPEFAGALAIEKSVREDSFSLLVSGHYEAPYGVLGAAFDVAVGRRIARASARDLLFTIADYVEYATAHDQAARAGQFRTISAPADTA